MERTTGTVKWFSSEKGFGFIQRTDGPDVFVHYTSVEGRGFRSLEQGERVEFEIIEEPKGLKAQNVHRMDTPVGAVGDAGDRADDPRRDPYGGWNREEAATDWSRGRREQPSWHDRERVQRDW